MTGNIVYLGFASAGLPAIDSVIVDGSGRLFGRSRSRGPDVVSTAGRFEAMGHSFAPP